MIVERMSKFIYPLKDCSCIKNLQKSVNVQKLVLRDFLWKELNKM